MSAATPLAIEVINLCALYREGSILLASFTSRTENFLEQMRDELDPEKFARAMNCIYIIEDINALCLDENRNPAKEEMDAILCNLDVLEKIINRNSKEHDI